MRFLLLVIQQALHTHSELFALPISRYNLTLNHEKKNAEYRVLTKVLKPLYRLARMLLKTCCNIDCN